MTKLNIIKWVWSLTLLLNLAIFRKRKNSSSKAVDVASKRKPKKVEKLESKPESNTDSGQDEEDVSVFLIWLLSVPPSLL